MKHTESGIQYHRNMTGCRGTMTKTVQEKGDLGSFEVWSCDGFGGRCSYVGRGRMLREGPVEIEGIVFEVDDDLHEL